MTATAASIVNRALQMIGDQVQITGSNPAFDGSVAGNAAGVLYEPAVTLMLRRNNPDFARVTKVLTAAVAFSGVIPPWTYEYVYLSDCLRCRQVRPPPSGAGALTDSNNPLPIPAQVQYDPNGNGSGSGERVILTNQQNAWLAYTSSNVGVGQEALWDTVFQEAVARFLANPLAMALAGRPDFAKELLAESEAIANMAELSEEF